MVTGLQAFGKPPTWFYPYSGTSLIRNCPPPQDHRQALGMALLYGPRRMWFSISEVPLYLLLFFINIQTLET